MKTAQSGVALVIVLWLIAILTLLMYAFLADMQVEYSVGVGYADGKKAEQLAWSAVDAACAALLNDTRTYQGLNNDPWSSDPSNFFEVPLGDGCYTVFCPLYDDAQTVLWTPDDEASKINLNTATKEMLLNLPNMTSDLADAIIEWRSPAGSAQAASGVGNSYYNGLNPPYNSKHQPFESLEELLYVEGMTPALLFGEDFNLNGRLEPNENDGDASWPPDNQDGLINPGFWSLCTVWSVDKNVDAQGKARVNLNTATPVQLEAAGLTPAESQTLTTRRAVLPFVSVAQLLGGSGIPAVLSPARFKLVVDHLTVNTAATIPGLINVNTASQQVLLCLPGMTPEVAQSIMDYRTVSGNDLSNIGWLLSVVDPAVFQRFANSITCRSYQYRIHAVGRVGTPYGQATGGSGDGAPARPGAFRRMVAVFDKLATPNPRLVYWKDQTKLGMPYDPQDGPYPNP
jgi:DNA uptake protein ComE-like DNA-binding protein